MRAAVLLTMMCLTSTAVAQLPTPPAELSPWPISYTDALPAVSAADLLDKPAGKHGPVVARDGHFYTGDKRIRFWGVNVCFAGAFPTHAEADKLAARFANLGINAVRFHHMDNQPFPAGIFADRGFEKLSPEAMDRLDYFIAALKKQGIYANLNLHVSRMWTRSKGWPDAEKLDGYDKVLDIFHPDLIAANKQYARDLLTHVNKYTGNRYADEPAVCMVEINNEDTIFLWNGEDRLADLPPRYAAILQQQWNAWLAATYGSREKLKAAWTAGDQPLGENLLAGGWDHELHHGAQMNVGSSPYATVLEVTKVTGTDWHVQFKHPLKVKKGQFYTIRFSTQVDEPRRLAVGVGMAHAPWENLGFTAQLRLEPGEPKQHRFGFIATADDDNARLSFVVGQQTGKITLSDLLLAEGGQEGLADDEDPAAGNVRMKSQGAIGSQPRNEDWFRFLQHTDETYWVQMRNFLRDEIGVKAPITGTIALGPLGLIAQAKMDFVDTHTYWDHPSFPRKAWDSKDWLIDNDAMVDNPHRSALLALAAARVLGKPHTVTEYNHSAPNDWQAECVPMIASFAALQDWDAVFLFAYSHNANFDKRHTTGFFDLEGNPAKIPFLPLGARVFLGRDATGGIAPLRAMQLIEPSQQEMLSTASRYFSSLWPFVRDVKGVRPEHLLSGRLVTSFQTVAMPGQPIEDPARARWTTQDRPGGGRYSVVDDRGIVFAGFPGADEIDLGPVKLGPMQSPFVTLMLVPADPTKPIAEADRLLLATVARVENTGMKWTPDRRSVSNHWGQPPARVEIVRGQLSLAGRWQVRALKPDGTGGEVIPTTRETGRTVVELGTTATLWYELTRVE